MDIIWGMMVVGGIVYAAFTGNLQAVTDAALSSSREAVQLCIAMAGVMAFWVGLMEIAGACGMIQAFTRKIKPLIRFLFPGIPKGHPAGEQIAVNFIANFLGLGWAATPAGLRAMEELAKLEEERRGQGNAGGDRKPMPRGIASNEMCTFLILNISSLQLIPVNIIAYRSQYGSVNPTAIVGPGILATAVSTAVAVIFCKMADCRKRRA